MQYASLWMQSVAGHGAPGAASAVAKLVRGSIVEQPQLPPPPPPLGPKGREMNGCRPARLEMDLTTALRLVSRCVHRRTDPLEPTRSGFRHTA
jgi:hypothetical protein